MSNCWNCISWIKWLKYQGLRIFLRLGRVKLQLCVHVICFHSTAVCRGVKYKVNSFWVGIMMAVFTDAIDAALTCAVRSNDYISYQGSFYFVFLNAETKLYYNSKLFTWTVLQIFYHILCFLTLWPYWSHKWTDQIIIF